jgi:hypothetical protein
MMSENKALHQTATCDGVEHSGMCDPRNSTRYETEFMAGTICDTI